MKKLTTLIALPLLAASACTPQNPKWEDYDRLSATKSLGPFINASIKNFDNDTLADAIVSERGIAIFYAKGYEDKLNITKQSIEMTPEFRESAANFIKADNMLEYEYAKSIYDNSLSKYDTADLRKIGKIVPERINPFQDPINNDSLLKSMLQMNQRRTLDKSEKDSLWNSLTRDQREKLVKDYYANQHNKGEKK